MAYTILLVDDSETIRSALDRTFTMAKLPIDEVIEAADGREALEIIEKKWVDIVLSDINMPKMNGIDLIKSMKAHPEYKEIPVAVISTEGSKARITELEKLGIVGYLRKPCRPEEIRDLLQDVLGGWSHD